MDLNKQVANKLKKERIKAGYSSSEKFVNESDIGLGRTQYQEYESGKSVPKIETLHKILKALGLTLTDFLKGID